MTVIDRKRSEFITSKTPKYVKYVKYKRGKKKKYIYIFINTVKYTQELHCEGGVAKVGV